MKKPLLSAAVVLTSLAMLGGCTKSNIVNADHQTVAVTGNPEDGAPENVEIDWEQVADDAHSIFDDKTEYPNSVKFSIYLNQETKEIMLLWAVDDKFSAEDLGRYAEDALKMFNDIVATQDGKIAMSDENSYGGLWKDYGVSLGIMPDSTKDDRDTWYLDCEYPAGEDFKLPDTKAALEVLKKHAAEEAAAAKTSAAVEETESSSEAEEEEADETESETETKAQ